MNRFFSYKLSLKIDYERMGSKVCSLKLNVVSSQSFSAKCSIRKVDLYTHCVDECVLET